MIHKKTLSIKHLYLGLESTMGYFTILPVRFRSEDDLSHPKVLGAMLFWLPFAGLVTTGGSVLLYLLLAKLGWLGAVVAAVAYPALYGFLHTEAVADVADALYAAHSGKDPYTVIKDPTVGAMGVLWTATVLLLKTALVTYLLLHGAWTLFVAVAISSRLGLEMLFWTQRFRSAFIEKLQEGFEGSYFGGSAVLFSLVGLIFLGWKFLPLLALSLLSNYLVAALIGHKLGFLNGDVLGTTLESTEIIMMLAGALLWL